MVKLNMTGVEITTALDQFFTTTLHEANVKLHTILVQAMLWAQKKEDCGPMGYAIEKARKSSIKAGPVVDWVLKFSPIRLTIGSDGKTKVWRLLKDTEEGYVPFNVQGAVDSPFYTMGKAETLEVLFGLDNLVSKVQGIIREAESKLKNEKIKDGQKDNVLKFIGNLRSILPAAAIVSPTEGNIGDEETFKAEAVLVN